MLIRRFLERKSGREGLVFGVVDIEGMAFFHRAFGVDVEQFGRDIANALHRLFLCLTPLVAAEPVQRRVFGADACIAADQVQRRDRHVEFVVVRVFEHQELRGHAAEFEGLQSQIASDAVLDMHDRRADRQFVQIVDDVFEFFRGRFTATTALLDFFAAQLALGDHGDRRTIQPQALIDRRNQHTWRLF